MWIGKEGKRHIDRERGEEGERVTDNVAIASAVTKSMKEASIYLNT